VKGTTHSGLIVAAIAALVLLAVLGPMHAQLPVAEATQVYALSSSISIELPTSWHAVKSDEIPSAGALAPYAPPFHFSQVATFTNEQQKSILLLGFSDNPLLGHDSYWLDAQMHAPSGSGMSLLDLLFYFFFPPSQACMENALQNYADATMTPPSEDAPPRLQVTYACPHSPTLSGFYSAQVSSGFTFEQTNSGPKAYGVIRDFYLSPMEQADISGLTIYSFEAQRQGQISKAAVGHYNLPESLQGSRSDFFWAIGAQSPFPFVADGRSIPLLHVGYATSAAATNNGQEFSRLLHGIRTK
jgi:hypothetical protein